MRHPPSFIPIQALHPQVTIIIGRDHVLVESKGRDVKCQVLERTPDRTAHLSKLLFPRNIEPNSKSTNTRYVFR